MGKTRVTQKTAVRGQHPSRVLYRVRLWLAGVMLGLYITAAGFVVALQAIPLRYLVPALFLSTVMVIGLAVALSRRQPSRLVAVAGGVVALLVIAGSIYTVVLSQSMTSFFAAIQPKQLTNEQYVIIAKTTRHMTLADARSSAILQTDPSHDDVVAALAEVTSAQALDYPDLTSAMLALENDTVDTVTVHTGSAQLLADNYPDFEATFEVIARLTVTVEHASPSPDQSGATPFVVYISGIDTAGDVASVARSDVNILAVVNPLTHSVLLVNTPRDYYVQLPGTTGARDKLTHAGVYGIEMSRRTLEALYGIQIDNYIRVNFTSLVTVVDALGGIDVYSDRAFRSFQAGYNRVDGKRALEFSRERYSFQDGDRQRGKNQQRVIEAIIAKMSDPQYIGNYRAILRALEGAVQTDISPHMLTQLANNQLDGMQRWRVESISVDGAGAMAPTYSMGSLPLSVIEPDQQTVDHATRKIQEYLTE